MKFTNNPLFSALGLSLAASLTANAITWDGGASQSDNWSGSASSGNAGNRNWDTNAAPTAGNPLVFAGTTRLTPNNNTTADTSYAGITFSNTAGAFVLGGNRITLGGNVINNDTQLQTINMAMILSADRTFNAASGDIVVGGVISNGFGIIKTGNSSLTLNVSNSYTGTTDVQAGTLFANNASGSGTGTGAVSVGVNGKLGGTGTIAPTGSNAINVSGVLAPGGSVSTGNLTLDLANTSGIVTMASGSSFQYGLGVAGLSISSFGTSDLLTIAGASASDFAFGGNNIDLLSTGAVGFYKLFDTSSNLANTWTGLTFDGTTGLISGGLTFSNLAGTLTGSLLVGTAGNGGTTGDIYLQVVPEPSSALLGGLGALFLLRRRRSA